MTELEKLKAARDATYAAWIAARAYYAALVDDLAAARDAALDDALVAALVAARDAAYNAALDAHAVARDAYNAAARATLAAQTKEQDA